MDNAELDHDYHLQALFYMFIFRHKQLLDLEGGELLVWSLVNCYSYIFLSLPVKFLDKSTTVIIR